MYCRSCRNIPHLSIVALLGLLALPIGGCQTASITDITGSTGGALDAFSRSAAKTKGEPQTKEDWRREASAAGQRYRADPKDAGAALDYADALRRTGQRAQSAAVLQQASIHHPRDRRLLGAYGRALADTGNLTQALEVLNRAHTPDQPDWRILSAQGAVLDQMGRHQEARRYYTTALKIVPGEPAVLSNLGLSYALSKDLKLAEETLRKASSSRGEVDHRVRQNLALVVGLQGRFKEAEEIVRADLPPAKAAENIAYLRQMLAQHESDKPRGRAHASNRAG